LSNADKGAVGLIPALELASLTLCQYWSFLMFLFFFEYYFSFDLWAEVGVSDDK